MMVQQEIRQNEKSGCDEKSGVVRNGGMMKSTGGHCQHHVGTLSRMADEHDMSKVQHATEVAER